MPGDSVDVKLGVVRGAPANLQLYVDGVPWDVPWPDGYSPSLGDSFKVLTVNGEVILWPYTPRPRPLLGDVPSGATPSGGFIAVDAVDGTRYRCRYDGPAPSAGTRVLITWPGSVPFVRDAAVAAAASDPTLPPGAGPSAPTAPDRGVTTLIATHAGTWRPSFGSWTAGDVVQGTWSGSTYRGAWFYGAAGAFLAGKVIEAINLTVGFRAARGNHNDTLAAHFVLASGIGPGDWDDLTFPTHDVNIPGAWKGGDVNTHVVALPPGWGPLIAAGCGIGITGNPYLGFTGGAPSGRLDISWRTA